MAPINANPLVNNSPDPAGRAHVGNPGHSDVVAFKPTPPLEKATKIVRQVLELQKFDPGPATGIAGKILALISGALRSDGEASIATLLGKMPDYLGARDLQMFDAGLATLKERDPGRADWYDSIGSNWTDDQKSRFVKGVSLLMDEKIDGKWSDGEFEQSVHLLINAIDVVQVDGSLLSPEELERWDDYREANPDIIREVNFAAHGKSSTEIAEAMRMLINGAYGQDVVAWLRSDGADMSGGGRRGIAGRTNVAGGTGEPDNAPEPEPETVITEHQTVETADPRDDLHTYQESINNRPTTGPLAGVIGASELESLRGRLMRLMDNPDPSSEWAYLGSGAFKDVFLHTDPDSGKRSIVILTDEANTVELLRLEQMHRLGISGEVDWGNSIFIPNRNFPRFGTAGIVMEYREGVTLETVIRNPATTAEQKLEIAKNLAETFAPMHMMGMVTRDFKDDNVLINGTEVIPIDFGLMQSIRLDGVTFQLELNRIMTYAVFNLMSASHSNPQEAMRQFKDWYIAEAEKHLTVQSKNGGQHESTTRRAILEQAREIFDNALARMEGWNY